MLRRLVVAGWLCRAGGEAGRVILWQRGFDRALVESGFGRMRLPEVRGCGSGRSRMHEMRVQALERAGGFREIWHISVPHCDTALCGQALAASVSSTSVTDVGETKPAGKSEEEHCTACMGAYTAKVAG